MKELVFDFRIFLWVFECTVRRAGEASDGFPHELFLNTDGIEAFLGSVCPGVVWVVGDAASLKDLGRLRSADAPATYHASTGIDLACCI